LKTIPAQLLAHEALTVTTLCLLAKVECVGTYAGTILSFASLDIDVDYDDGDGTLTYSAQNGFTPKRLAQSAGQTVDNSELDGVIRDTGITMAQVRAGLFQSAKLTIYRVNYNDLTAGRHEVVAYGRAGETKFANDQWVTEFRSLSQLLKQPISQPYSLTCRAQFGDARCGESLVWTNGTVSSLGTETDREFSDVTLSSNTGYYSDHGGVVEWLTGDNTGAQMEVEEFTSSSAGSVIALSIPMPYAIQVGDTFRIRRDCDKKFSTCKDVYANTLNFRGENLIPVDGTVMVPGADIIKA